MRRPAPCIRRPALHTQRFYREMQEYYTPFPLPCTGGCGKSCLHLLDRALCYGREFPCSVTAPFLLPYRQSGGDLAPSQAADIPARSSVKDSGGCLPLKRIAPRAPGARIKRDSPAKPPWNPFFTRKLPQREKASQSLRYDFLKGNNRANTFRITSLEG